MDYKPDFYIIPGVIADDERIPYAGGKLYAIIYWLHSLALGKCIASNDVLAGFMGKRTTSDYISRLLKLLEDCGYIQREFSDEGKQTRVSICPLVSYRGVDGFTGVGRRKDTGGVDEKIQHISKIYKEEYKEDILSTKLGKTQLGRLKGFYTLLYRDTFCSEPRVFLNGKDGAVLKSLLKEYSEVQVAALMVLHFNWYGPVGQDENSFARLKEAAFPITWLPNNVNRYFVYLESVHGVKPNDSGAVLGFVKHYLEEISTGSSVQFAW